MKLHIIRIFTIFFLIYSILGSCTTQGIEQTDTEDTATVDVQPETDVPEEPETIESEEELHDTGEFVVTEEVYQETFEDIEALIAKINGAVITQDYEQWLTYLTEDYKEYWSDPETLKRISDDLYKASGYRVRLRNLKDYFTYVVVNSRIDIELDKIEFIDENRITAESIINDTPYILYYLERVDGVWKIGKW